MTPEQELLLAILRQAMRDYMRLDPDSDKVSAEFYIDEGEDYKTAEDFLFNNAPLPFPKPFTFRDICTTLGIDPRRIKKKINRNIIEY